MTRPGSTWAGFERAHRLRSAADMVSFRSQKVSLACHIPMPPESKCLLKKSPGVP
jgi:hypothetical protein